MSNRICSKCGGSVRMDHVYCTGCGWKQTFSFWQGILSMAGLTWPLLSVGLVITSELWLFNLGQHLGYVEWAVDVFIPVVLGYGLCVFVLTILLTVTRP